MTGRRIGLVAWHVFKESVRDRVLYGIGGFALLLVAGAIAIGQITAGQDIKIIKDLGLATIEIAGALMTMFIGVGLVSREIERRSIFGLLAKPLPRWEFILGKYLGLVLTIAVNLWVMGLALWSVLAWMAWTSPENIRLSWVTPAVDPRLAVVLLMITLEMALLTAVALFFSTFSSSALVSVGLTVGVFVAGLLSTDLRHFGDMVVAPPLVISLVAGVGWALPAFSEFDVKSQVVHGLPISAGFVFHTVLYAVVYALSVLGAAVFIFARREFK
jgi:ABC-type transport system involved in multi-copper enzyme maturation permease subunit